MIKKRHSCPKCRSLRVQKRGKQDGVQTYSCDDCGSRFQSHRRIHIRFLTNLWNDYVFHKQTLNELAVKYHHDRRTIRKELNSYLLPKKIHYPRPVHLIVDATYFGERTNETSWCVLVFKDAETSEDLWWLFTETETTIAYHTGRKIFEDLGYTILSVTGDGFAGIRSAFYEVPFQMCHVHMERLVINGTTWKPQLEAGVVLLTLVRSIHITDKETFMRRLNLYIEKYRDFLNQRSIAPETGVPFWTHKNLRKAAESLKRFSPYLFTYETDKLIPKTTNALEGHFSHVKNVVGVHRGLSRTQKEKVIHTILLNSSIAPKEK